jgi:serine protease Do
MRGLPKIVAQTPIGKAVEVEVMRRREKVKLSVTVGQLDDPEEAQPLSSEEKKEEKIPEAASILGLRLIPLNDALRQQFGFDPKMSGLLVTEIDPEGPSVSKNIRVGDVIIEAQQEAVTTTAGLEDTIEKVKRTGAKTIILLVEDAKGDTRFIGVPFP